MHIAYIAITILAALANCYAAFMSLTGAESVKRVADRVRVSRNWMTPFGILLAAGSIGLLIGFAMPALGALAASGLIIYFVCALGAHFRAHDTGFGGAAFFLVLAACALVTNLAYNGG